MAVDVYYTSVTPSRQIKQQQREVTRILESRRVPYQLIDVAVDESVLEEMRSRAGDPDALPPQIFNDGDYLGDYLRLYEAVEDEAFELFLKFAPSPGDKPLVRVDFSRCRADDGKTPEAEEARRVSAVEVKATVQRYERQKEEETGEEGEDHGVAEDFKMEKEEEAEEVDDGKEEAKNKLEEDVGETRTPTEVGAAAEDETERPSIAAPSLSDQRDTAAATPVVTARHQEAETGPERTTEPQRLPEIEPADSPAERRVGVAQPKPISLPDAFKRRAATSSDDGADGKPSDARAAAAAALGFGGEPAEAASAAVTTATARTSQLPQILQAVLVPVPSREANAAHGGAHSPEEGATSTVAAAAAAPTRRRAPAVPMRQKNRPRGRPGKGRAPQPPTTAGGDRRRGEAAAPGSETGKLVQVSIRDAEAVVRRSVLEPVARPTVVAETPEEKAPEQEDVETAGKGKKGKKKGRGMCSQQ